MSKRAATKRLVWMLSITMLFGGTSLCRAALIGNDPTVEAWDYGMDGHQVLSIQKQNPILQIGYLDSFSFYTGTVPAGAFTGPFKFAALVLRPTGTADQYTVIFDSGDLDASTYIDGFVYTINIAPLAVQPNDLIASWGRGVGFDFPTTLEDTWYYNGTQFGTLKPTGTFFAPGAGYTLDQPLGLGGTGNREYALAFNFVPEPTSLSLLLAGSLGWIMCRRRKRCAI